MGLRVWGGVKVETWTPTPWLTSTCVLSSLFRRVGLVMWMVVVVLRQGIGVSELWSSAA